jgi:uncharacterized protein YjiS (DUF1127 family)
MSQSYSIREPIPGRSARATARQLLRGYTDTMASWLGRRQGSYDLSALDDRQLNDVGIVREYPSQGRRTVFRRADEPAGFAVRPSGP